MSGRSDDNRREKRRRDERDADDETPSASLPDVHVQDSGGEISMSVEDTNKMRIALGLKPLKLDSGPSKPAKEASKEPAKPSKPSADDIRDKIKQSRDKRRAEQLLAAKPLGAADDAEDDDVFAWVQKIRHKTENSEREEGERPSKATRRGRRKDRRRRDDDEDDEDEEDGERYTAEELAGMKVRHDYKDLGEGEMMVLTLADKSILDEKGGLMEEDDELENVLKAEDKKRRKAREASQKKAKPLFEEDGKKRSLLDKYDEEEEDMIRLGDEAALESRREKVKEEVRKKLAASVEQLGAAAKSNADYYTGEEMATIFKKKKRKKEKKIRQKPQDDDEEGGDTAGLMEALEAEAEQQQDGKSSDLGKRGERMTARERAAAEEAARVQERRGRFDKALEKANWAALALKKDSKGNANDQDDEDEADAELYESLARARRAAAKEAAARGSKLEEVAEMIAKKREEDEKKSIDKPDSAAGVLEFTETREFIHNIQPALEEQPVVSSKPVKIEVDEKPDVAVKEDEGDGAGGSRRGKWVSADKARLREKDKDDRMDASDEEEEEEGKKKKQEEELDLTGQKAIGKGLAGCLGLLKESGQLQAKLQWAGRTNDKKKTQLMGLDDVYTGGLSEDQIALDIEVALTQKDEYGRILTPKERFRDLSYRFHGKGPSKNKQEKRMKQAADEIARRKAATSENPSANIEQMREMYARSGTPYVVLQGKDSRPAPTSSKSSKSSKTPATPGGTSTKTAMKTPVLGGGYTPLTDPQRKVQAMYGISKPGTSSGSMLPPPPRKPPT